MQCGRQTVTDREGGCEREQKWDASVSASTPELCVGPLLRRCREKPADRERDPRRTPRDGHSASESNLQGKQNESAVEDSIPIEPKSIASGDKRSPKSSMMAMECSSSSQQKKNYAVLPVHSIPYHATRKYRQEKAARHCMPGKKTRTGGSESQIMSPVDSDSAMLRQVRDIHNDMRSSARIIKDSRARLVELQKKTHMTDLDVKELTDRHELLLREMERFDRLTRSVQRLVDHYVVVLPKVRDNPRRAASPITSKPNPCYDSVVYQEMTMQHPTVMLGHTHAHRFPIASPDSSDAEATRSKSEIDLTRKLNESYDMQEKLVADNADLEVKRYILYKELMTKDQNLETCRAQIKRLQGELKLMSKENALLHDKIARNCPEGDASTLKNNDHSKLNEIHKNLTEKQDSKCDLLVSKLESYHSSATNFENQLVGLESEVRVVREDMDKLKKLAETTSLAGAGKPACAKGTCITPAKKATSKSGTPCGVCPPCPAPCNLADPPTPAEKEVAKIFCQYKNLEENYRTKVTECSILRTELGKKKEDLEALKIQHKELTTKLKAAEQQIDLMMTHNNMMMGTKDQAAEVEINVRMLKQCYREAREEIDELRLLLKEQNEQLQNYRNKYMQSMQTVEEQKRMLENMDMDNARISEQINLEIQKIKNNFKEKLLEVAPLPELLQKTQAKLTEALQSQAMAEHKAEKLASELTIAREKIHTLLYNITKPPDRSNERRDEQLIEVLQQRITQLTQSNGALKEEIERLKANVIRMEEAVIVNESRLSEKMTECVHLGGELDRVRDESARAVVKANDRTETLRMTLQTTKIEMERQIAAGRAKLRAAEKECQEIQCRMNCQIKRLKENYEQSQLRILSLTTTIAKLRQGLDHGDGDSESTEDCMCGAIIK